MEQSHKYEIQIRWTGNLGKGTKDYKSYTRNYEIQTVGKPIILGSSDPSFRGDADRYSPEDIFVSTLSSCHMLWYLHLCSVSKITVVEYIDMAKGTMIEQSDGSGFFKEVLLQPQIVILEEEKLVLAKELHHKAHAMCFIANSVNFPILCEASIKVQTGRREQRIGKRD